MLTTYLIFFMIRTMIIKSKKVMMIIRKIIMTIIIKKKNIITSNVTITIWGFTRKKFKTAAPIVKFGWFLFFSSFFYFKFRFLIITLLLLLFLILLSLNDVPNRCFKSNLTTTAAPLHFISFQFHLAQLRSRQISHPIDYYAKM